MANRRTSTSEGETIKKGLLTKSPPPYLFNKRSSWKARIFRLFKTPENKYILRYYGSNGLYEEVKGTIDIHDIKAVALGTPGSDKIALILRTLNTDAIEAENVIFLKTAKRDFYFVDENKEEIASWFKCISEAWMEINRSSDTSGPTITHQRPAYIAGPRDPRPQSFPNNQPQTAYKITEAERDRANTEPTSSNPINIVSPDNTRQRSGTAQGPYEHNFRFIINEPGATSGNSILPKVEEEIPQPDNDSDDESGRGSPPYDKLPTARLKSIYTSPKSIDQQDSCETTSDLNSEECSNDEENEEEEVIYEPMESGVCSPDRQEVNPSPDRQEVNPSPDRQEVNPSPDPERDIPSPDPEGITVLTGPGKCSVATGSEEYNVPTVSEEYNVSTVSEEYNVSTDSEEYNVSTDSEECNKSTDSEEYNVSNNPERENVLTNPNVQSTNTSTPTNKYRPNGGNRGSQLPRTAILRLRFDPQYNSVEMENLRITVPKEHLQKYFALQKVGDDLCVTKWKGPVEIGCLFHHGDQIDRINDYKVDTCADFFRLLQFTEASEITLTVTRNPTTAVFHMEGCNCGKS